MRRFLIRWLARLLLILAAALGLFLIFRSHYRPLLRELAQTQIKNATSTSNLGINLIYAKIILICYA